MGSRKKPTPPMDDDERLRLIAEILRQRGVVPDDKQAEHDRRNGGEAGNENESPSTPDGEPGMPTTDDSIAPSPRYHVTPRRYLVRERRAAWKSEYNDGEVVAMAGVSRRHSLIATALMVSLVNRLRGRGCEVHGGDLRVKADEGRRYVYPDVSVVCGRPVLEGKGPDVLTNPTVVFEILSDSTESRDRGWKLDAYRRMPSVGEVVLLSQNEPLAEVFRREPGGQWEALLPVRGMDALLQLEAIGCTVPLSEVYAGLKPAYAG